MNVNPLSEVSLFLFFCSHSSELYFAFTQCSECRHYKKYRVATLFGFSQLYAAKQNLWIDNFLLNLYLGGIKVCLHVFENTMLLSI